MFRDRVHWYREEDRDNLYICIRNMLDKETISLCSETLEQYVSPIFTVLKSDGSPRFILNLKELNLAIPTEHFKMEDIRTAVNLMSEGCFLATIDLTEAYFSIPIHRESKKFLRFRFEDQLFEFNYMPFGLCTAPYVFTKVLRPILAYLRNKGWISVNYLDDFLCIGKDFKNCEENVRCTMFTLQSLGFHINFMKSRLVPQQECKFLGFILNSRDMSLSLPDDKIDKILQKIKSIMQKDQGKIRELAELIGTLVSVCPATEYGWVYIKKLEFIKCRALRGAQENYDQKIGFPKEIRVDLTWWRENIPQARNRIKKFIFTRTITSDASRSGWGAVCNDNKTGGFWSEEESKLHINILELKAAFFAIKCYAVDLADCEILLRIDNTTAISYINKMGGTQCVLLNEIARQLWHWCEDRRLWVFAAYIKSIDNSEADAESRRLKTELEFELPDWAFREIVIEFGEPEIDLFATRLNSKCKRFTSWKKDPEAIAVNAFTISWKNLRFYAFPNFSMIARVLQKVRNDEAEGILVIPFWPTQAWFPVFSSMRISKLIKFTPTVALSNCRTDHPLQVTLAAAKISGKSP